MAISARGHAVPPTSAPKHCEDPFHARTSAGQEPVSVTSMRGCPGVTRKGVMGVRHARPHTTKGKIILKDVNGKIYKGMA